MKIRTGFVSNSSDASFAIPLKLLSPLQVEAIIRHTSVGELLGIDWPGDAWYIGFSDTHIIGDTSMDNFDMDALFEHLGIPDNIVQRDSANGNWACSPVPSWAHADRDPRLPGACGFPASVIERYKMSDQEFFMEFLKSKDFESLKVMAEKSEHVRKILADPNFKVGED